MVYNNKYNIVSSCSSLDLIFVWSFHTISSSAIVSITNGSAIFVCFVCEDRAFLCAKDEVLQSPGILSIRGDKEPMPIVSILASAKYLQLTEVPQRCWADIKDDGIVTIWVFGKVFGGTDAELSARRLFHMNIFVASYRKYSNLIG